MSMSSFVTRAASVFAEDALVSCARYGLVPEAIMAGLTPDFGFPRWLQELSRGDTGTIRPDERPVLLETPSGVLRGTERDGLRIFRGVRYAQETSGARRFAPPEPVPAWDDVYDATRYGSVVVQPGAEETEDGLFLNVWAPAGGEGLPVFVFVHGGAFLFGAGSLHLYESSRLAASGIVVVTINYRLQSPGFFPSQTTLDLYGTTGNWGLLDVLCALRWVRKHIAAFGGDPQRVTLGGQSAGAFAISAMISSPLARGLFRQAILQSGGLGSMPAAAPQTGGDCARNIRLARTVLAKVGLEDTREGLQRLRELSPSEILALQPELDDIMPPQSKIFWPVFDGGLLPLRPRAALRAGRLNRVRLLFGSTTDEVSFFIPPTATEAQYRTLLRGSLGVRAEEALARYPVNREADAHARCCAFANAAGIRAGMFPYADALAGMGEAVYAYRFDGMDPLLRRTPVGVPHAADLKFVFHNHLDEALADAVEMQNVWTNFIKHGDPNEGAPISAKWLPYTKEARHEMKLGRGSKMEPIYQGELIDFVSRLFDETEDAGA